MMGFERRFPFEPFDPLVPSALRNLPATDVVSGAAVSLAESDSADLCCRSCSDCTASGAKDMESLFTPGVSWGCFASGNQERLVLPPCCRSQLGQAKCQ